MKIKLNGKKYSANKRYVFEAAEPILIEVESTAPTIINGMESKRIFHQFKKTGKNSIVIVSGNDIKEIIVDIKKTEKNRFLDISNRAGRRKIDKQYSYIVCTQDFSNSDIINLHIDKKLKRGEKIIWHISGKKYYKQGTSINVDVNNLLEKGKEKTILDFNVELIRPYSHGSQQIGKRTVILYNQYEIDKKKGILKPKLFYDEIIKKEHKGASPGRYEFKCKVVNVEDDVLRLDKKSVEFLIEGSDSVILKTKNINTQIKPNSEKELSISFDNTTIPDNAFGAAVHFSGVSQSKKKVHIDIYVEFAEKLVKQNISNIEKFAIPKSIMDLVPSLEDGNYNFISHDELVEKFKERKNKNAIANSKEIAFLENPNSGKAFSFPFIFMSYNDENDNDNKPCSEYQEGDTKNTEYGEYVCQMIPDGFDWVHVPARIINAKKGDIILTPSGNSLVGNFLAKTNPPQHYSHSGIMVENYSKIRHSTASEEWIADNLTRDDKGLDLNIDGIFPDAVKYGWPGTITQSISEAYYGQKLKGKQYYSYSRGVTKFTDKDYVLKSFSQYNSFENMEPKVVKPNPIDEANDFERDNKHNVRTILKKVADAAKSIDGHYRLYAYTKADIYNDSEFEAPSDVIDRFWANNEGRNPVKPTVCSSFIWAAVKSIDENIVLEGKLEADEKNVSSDNYTKKDNETPDGLYLYSEPERLGALLNLHNNLKCETDETIGGAADIINFFEHVSEEIANQFCNAFASDSCGDSSIESEAWRNPGVGRAVSPSDILKHWDGFHANGNKYGLYGYNEKLIYRPERYLKVPKYKWVKTKAKGVISGKIVDHNGNPMPDLQVNYTNNLHVVTDNKGEFRISFYPGHYILTAFKEVNGIVYQGQKEIEIIEDATIDNVKLILNPPKDIRRIVNLRVNIHMVDDGGLFAPDSSSDFIKTFNKIYLDVEIPNKAYKVIDFSQDYGGEVRGAFRIELNALYDGSIRVSYQLKMYENDDVKENYDEDDFKKETTGSFIVPKDVRDYVHKLEKLTDDGDVVDASFILDNLQYQGA